MLPTFLPKDPFPVTRVTRGPKLPVPQVFHFIHFNGSHGVKVSLGGQQF